MGSLALKTIALSHLKHSRNEPPPRLTTPRKLLRAYYGKLSGTPKAEQFTELPHNERLTITAIDRYALTAASDWNISIRASANQAPYLAQTPNPVQATAGQAFWANFSAIFADPDEGDHLYYQATFNGQPLPAGLSFSGDGDSFWLQGTAPEAGEWSLQVTASDEGGLQASVAMAVIAVAEPPPPPGEPSFNAIEGTEGDDILTGTANSDRILGYGGNDHLSGDAGDDTLDGGAGDDHLHAGTGWNLVTGGEGNDTYLFNRGDETLEIDDFVASEVVPDDEIDPSQLTQDRLELGEGITIQQLWFQRDWDNLLIRIIGSDERIIIRDWYLNRWYPVEAIDTWDHYRLTPARVEALVDVMAGYEFPATDTTLPPALRATIDPVINA